MKEELSIAVIGSGIIGMSTALRLSECGFKVSIVSRDSYSKTTSAVAAAFWYPYKAEPAELVSSWAQNSLAVYREALNTPDAGVKWHRFTEYIHPTANRPWWSTSVDSFEFDDRLIELPAGRRHACNYEAPLIDTSRYLPFLHSKLIERGVQFLEGSLTSIDEAFEIGNLVVNCSGIGAIDLCNDHDLHPARGQVVRIKRQPHHVPLIDLTFEPKIAHITPRTEDTVLGGTYDENQPDLAVSPDETEAIVQRCKNIFPALGELTDSEILGVSCGLRPVRSSVRVEREQRGPGKWVIHNYGHGGAGFTLAWGCAEAICELVNSCSNN